MKRKTIVVSAISVRSGGTLSILQDCIQELNSEKYSQFDIVAIIKDRKLLNEVGKNIRFIEIDGSRSYLKRLYYEYFYFKKISKELNATLWFSLHDVTPNVSAERLVVYCHNPILFAKIPFRYYTFEPTMMVFKFFYWFVYFKNISKNSFVVVQQNWMRQCFNSYFGVPNSKIVVAHPNINIPKENHNASSSQKVFLFPTLPRPFKNVELIGEAIELLIKKDVIDFTVLITIEGSENRYAHWLLKKFGHLKQIKFIGIQSRQDIFKLYSKVDCLIFPSTVETWGLPISEFKSFNKPMLLADLPYAHETASNHEKVRFFDPTSPIELASLMNEIITEQIVFQQPVFQDVVEPFCLNWDSLFKILLQNV